MPLRSIEKWERKAAQARHAASILLSTSAKATMLEMADHYWKLASAARRGITKQVQTNDYWRTCPRRIPLSRRWCMSSYQGVSFRPPVV